MYDRRISKNNSIRMMIVSDGDRTNRICDSNISDTFIVLLYERKCIASVFTFWILVYD